MLETPLARYRLRTPSCRSVCHRGRWAVAVHLLALTGLFVEQHMQILKRSPIDPYADTPTTAAYFFAACILLLNEYALRRRWRQVAWLRNIALIGTGAALPVALSAAMFLLPWLPFAVVAIAFMGLGLLAFVPYLTVGIYVAQWRAIGAAAQEYGNPIPRWVVLAAALAGLLMAGWWGIHFADYYQIGVPGMMDVNVAPDSPAPLDCDC
jgi:hypothetical protein